MTTNSGTSNIKRKISLEKKMKGLILACRRNKYVLVANKHPFKLNKTEMRGSVDRDLLHYFQIIKRTSQAWDVLQLQEKSHYKSREATN
jgi:hypothetical protein